MKITKEIVERAFVNNGYEESLQVESNREKVIATLSICENGTFNGFELKAINSALFDVVVETYNKYPNSSDYLGEFEDYTDIQVKQNEVLILFDKVVFEKIESRFIEYMFIAEDWNDCELELFKNENDAKGYLCSKYKDYMPTWDNEGKLIATTKDANRVLGKITIKEPHFN